ncbi:MAG: hypothetical protein HY901_26655 [Deltaproteobacteria bacterium]|nr:hypothetical protein [Deltaproteobacteria bacterium]
MHRSLSLLACLLMAAPAVAAAAEAELTPAQPTLSARLLEGFSGSAVGVAESVGLGTLVANENARTPTVATQLSLAPRFGFEARGTKLALAARQNLSFEQTRPDNPTGRRFDLDDLRLGLAAPKILAHEGTGLSFTPSLRYLVPTSYASRWSGSYGNLGGALGLAWSKLGIELSYGFGLNKGFPRYEARSVSEAETMTDPDGRAVVLCRGAEGFCASSGMNPNWGLSNALSARYSYKKRVSVALSYVLINQFHYAATDVADPYTSKKTDTDGNPVVKVGAGRSDVVWGTLEVEVALVDHLSLGLSIVNVGPAKTRDNKRLRFPFFDTESAADNLTSFSLGLTASL